MLEIKSTVSSTFTPPLSHQAAPGPAIPTSHSLQSLSTGGSGPVLLSPGAAQLLCPCGDIELLRGNTGGWERFVTKDCHPQLWTQALPLGMQCLDKGGMGGVVYARCELWDVQCHGCFSVLVETPNSFSGATEIVVRQLNLPVDAEESNDFSQGTYSLTL